MCFPGVTTEQSKPMGGSFPGTAAATPAASAQSAAPPQQPAAHPALQLPPPQTLPAPQARAQQVNDYALCQFLFILFVVALYLQQSKDSF